MNTIIKFLLIALPNLLVAQPAQATDLIRFGGGAGNQGAGGIINIGSDSQSAVNANPALLTAIEDGSTLSLSLLAVDSNFSSSAGEQSRAGSGPGLLPQFALKRRIPDSAWSWGMGLSVVSAIQADFEFTDPPGTLGVSYGRQQHFSSYVVAKTSAALAYQLSDELSVGFTLDGYYNENQLKAPYIFQSHPALSGLKVLIDLEASDVAISGNLGLLWRLQDGFSISLAWSPEVDFSATGKLNGNLRELGLGIREDFRYEAEVKTGKPESFVASISWKANERLSIGFQYDWIGWQEPFRELPIYLTAGSNNDLNRFLGEDTLRDTAPLNWRNQQSYHVGLQYLLDSSAVIRFGIESHDVPVPAYTATPMTGAILEHALSAGVSFKVGQRPVDIAYRFSDSDNFEIRESLLKGGEYDNTALTLSLHTLTLSIAL